MARWIYEFRSVGERALSEPEKGWLKRRSRLLKLRSVLLALSSFVSFFGLVIGIAIAADKNLWGWAILTGSVVLAGYLLAWSGDASKLALLHRRALRVGLVEEFRRVRGDETVRRLWEGKSKAVDEADEDDDRDPSVDFMGNFWSVEEKFEESLARVARGKVETFEAVGRDGAVLWVEGKPVRKPIDCYVWESF